MFNMFTFNIIIYEHFLNKKIPEFWKCWSSKIHKNISKEVYIHGSNKDVDVAAQFSSVYCSSVDAADAKKELEALLSEANNDDFSKERLCELINVESVDRCIQNFKLGKALGPDGLNAEHFRYATLLLQFIYVHFFVA